MKSEKNNAYRILDRDEATTELRFSQCFYDQDDPEEHLPWYRDRVAEHIWRPPAVVTLGTLPVGELPKMRTWGLS
jgi:hypothetical protein